MKDARDIFLGCQRVLQQSSQHFRLVNSAAVQWNANHQRTLMSRFTSRPSQLLGQPLHFQRLANTSTMRLYHSNTTSSIQKRLLLFLAVNNISTKQTANYYNKAIAIDVKCSQRNAKIIFSSYFYTRNLLK